MDQQKLDETTEGLIGLVAGIEVSKAILNLSDDQVMMFCDATPNGEKLWDQFKERRDSDETPDGYDFTSFMSEVLVEAGKPFR